MIHTALTAPPVSPGKPIHDPGYGDAFTDHMVTARWSQRGGWTTPELQDCQYISMHPGTIGLHYGQVIFEGLKAYRQQDGTVAAFRPDVNARRFRRSARRLTMPELPEEMFLQAIDDIVAADQDFLSDNPRHSLYLRPVMFGSDASMMLRPSRDYLFFLIAFIVGGFFAEDLKAVSVWVSRNYSRASPGGTGDVKCASNYGPAFLAQREAEEAGCHQVVWLDAIERTWVEELGGMNLFFVRGSGAGAEVVTPPLRGTLLPGVTRDSILTLASRLGYRVGEEQISVDQWRRECEQGLITEVFACGTAASVSPVGLVKSDDGDWSVGDGNPGPVTLVLQRALTDVQHGVIPDQDGWLRRAPSVVKV